MPNEVETTYGKEPTFDEEYRYIEDQHKNKFYIRAAVWEQVKNEIDPAEWSSNKLAKYSDYVLTSLGGEYKNRFALSGQLLKNLLDPKVAIRDYWHARPQKARPVVKG
jgi:hypothetical protein